MQALAYIITPALPLFKVVRAGPANNNGVTRVAGYRLPLWLSWFDTPDNPLTGDYKWFARHGFGWSHWTMVAWLYRNSLYGFKRGPLAADVVIPSCIESFGNPAVNRNNGVTGVFRARYFGYWQIKVVRKIIGNRGIMFNFGWQLDEFVGREVGGMALFQFSPRFVSIK
jgi:hypothetical protein